MGRAAEIEAYVAALDPFLAPLGFRRRKRSQEWIRNLDDVHQDLFHLNFGLSIVNPSVAVKYRDISNVVPRDLGSWHASEMLVTLVPSRPTYDFTSTAKDLADDFIGFGMPFIEKLHDRDFVINQLSSQSPSDWCGSSYADRIRLLPLLLMAAGRTPQALKFIEDVLPESEARDQRIPHYKEFVHWFRNKAAAEPVK